MNEEQERWLAGAVERWHALRAKHEAEGLPPIEWQEDYGQWLREATGIDARRPASAGHWEGKQWVSATPPSAQAPQEPFEERPGDPDYERYPMGYPPGGRIGSEHGAATQD